MGPSATWHIYRIDIFRREKRVTTFLKHLSWRENFFISSCSPFTIEKTTIMFWTKLRFLTHGNHQYGSRCSCEDQRAGPQPRGKSEEELAKGESSAFFSPKSSTLHMLHWTEKEMAEPCAPLGAANQTTPPPQKHYTVSLNESLNFSHVLTNKNGDGEPTITKHKVADTSAGLSLLAWREKLY